MVQCSLNKPLTLSDLGNLKPCFSLQCFCLSNDTVKLLDTMQSELMFINCIEVYRGLFQDTSSSLFRGIEASVSEEPVYRETLEPAASMWILMSLNRGSLRILSDRLNSLSLNCVK